MINVPRRRRITHTPLSCMFKLLNLEMSGVAQVSEITMNYSVGIGAKRGYCHRRSQLPNSDEDNITWRTLQISRKKTDMSAGN